MKANEFIKKYGIAEAKSLVGTPSWTMRQIALSTIVDTKELTKLVESHELVEKVGGLLSAKANINEMVVDSGCSYVSDDAKLYDYDFSFGSLRKAIYDVESCQ